jgi:hypothetical protein
VAGVNAAAASLALEALLCGPSRPGRVIGAFPTAIYVWVPGGDPPVVSVVTSDGVRLPNAIVVPATSVDRPFAQVGEQTPAAVGNASVAVGTLEVRPVRWWSPRPRLDAIDPATLAAALTRAAARLALWPPPGPGALQLASSAAALGAAMGRSDAGGAAAAAQRLIGLGPGLTPAGDDVLAGALAAVSALDPSARLAGCHDALARVAVTAAGRTTTLSAALLRHAARGEVAAPAAAFLAALAGHGDPDAAAAALGRLGHSSGLDLAAGMMLTARALAREGWEVAG